MLKGFTEWYDLEAMEADFFGDERGYSSDEEEIKGLSAWEAALRWALAQSKQLEKEDAPITMREIILHELGEDNGRPDLQ